jgi:hypothetical protein
VLAVEQSDQRGDHVVLVHQLELLVDPVEDGDEGVVLEGADDVVVDGGTEHDRRADDRHHAVGLLQCPELADPVRVRLVLGIGEVGRAAHRPVLGNRLRVVREGAVGGRRGGDQHLLGPGLRGSLQDPLGAVDVDVIHLRLVPDRVEHEGEVDEHIDLVPGEQVPDRRSVADVLVNVFGLRPLPGRGAQVGVDDLLGLVAAREDLGESAADVPGSPGDQVAHALILSLAARPGSCERLLTVGDARTRRRQRTTATSCRIWC